MSDGRLVYNCALPNGSVALVLEFPGMYKIREIKKDGAKVARGNFMRPLYELREVIDIIKRNNMLWDLQARGDLLDFFLDSD